MSPLVSVILSTYNWNNKWISEAINSVLNQSYKNIELIIINDASTNNVEKTILDFVNKNNKVKYIKNEKNLWPSKSRNKWLEKVKWKYIAIIDDNDIWCKDKLKKQIEFMEKNKEYWLCWTWVIKIDEDWKEIIKVLHRESDNLIRKNILGANQFTHSSVVIRKSILDKVWWYIDNSLTKYVEDYDLILRIWTKSKFYNLNEYLVKYRLNKNGISHKKRIRQNINSFLISLKYRKYYPNKNIWFIKQVIRVILPNSILQKLVKLSKWKK